MTLADSNFFTSPALNLQATGKSLNLKCIQNSTLYLRVTYFWVLRTNGLNWTSGLLVLRLNCVISNLIRMNNHASQKKQVKAIWNWSSGELCGPWAFCFSFFRFGALTLHIHARLVQIKTLSNKASLIIWLSFWLESTNGRCLSRRFWQTFVASSHKTT